MGNTQYNLQFDKLSKTLNLGDIICTPEPISGGLLNRMFAIRTTKNTYAIKALNPQIMLRPTAMQNYVNSEHIANIAVKYIPAVPAIIFNGKSIQMIDGQFYLIFDWVNGRSLKQHEIELMHCRKMGEILADIHKIDFAELGLVDNYSGEESLTEWNYYLKQGEKYDAIWVDELRNNIESLYYWNNKLIASTKLLTADRVISHRDLDSKNIMWKNNDPFIIDWEAAGFINPRKDLLDTAIYWSKDESENIDKAKFLTFINAYKNKYGEIDADWKIVLDNGYALEWLEYSLKRSLWIECNDKSEQRMGTEHVIATISALQKYADTIQKIEEWLCNDI